jgi:hypothetical protein
MKITAGFDKAGELIAMGLHHDNRAAMRKVRQKIRAQGERRVASFETVDAARWLEPHVVVRLCDFGDNP